MKKIIVAVAALALFAGACSTEADVASENLSKAADQFEISRRIVFLNGITDGRENDACPVLEDLTPDAGYPLLYYPDDHTRASVAAGLDFKSRVLRANPMIPIGVELGAGVSGRIEAADVSELDPRTVDPVARFFVDLGVDSTPMFAFRIRSGVTRRPSTGAIGFMFAVQ